MLVVSVVKFDVFVGVNVFVVCCCSFPFVVVVMVVVVIGTCLRSSLYVVLCLMLSVV